MSVFLDVASKSANAAISGGGLVLSATNTSPNAGARADLLTTSGKLVFEVTFVVPIFCGTKIGMTKLATPDPTTDVGTVTIDQNGFLQINNVGAGTASVNNPVMVAVDFSIHRLWYSTGPSSWNGGGDPATGTGGLDISGIDGTGLYPYGVTFGPTFGDPVPRSTLTFNFAGPFGRSIPGGFLPYGPPPSSGFFRQNARLPRFRNAFSGLVAPPPFSARLAFTEQRDTFAGVLTPTLAANLAVTEARDTFAGVVQRTPPAALDDGDRLYVPVEPGLFTQPDFSHSRFVIPSSSTLKAG